MGGHLSPPRLTIDKAAADAVDRRKIRPAGQTSFNAGLVGVLPNSRKDHSRMEAVEDCQWQCAAEQDGPGQVSKEFNLPTQQYLCSKITILLKGIITKSTFFCSSTLSLLLTQCNFSLLAAKRHHHVSFIASTYDTALQNSFNVLYVFFPQDIIQYSPSNSVLPLFKPTSQCKR